MKPFHRAISAGLLALALAAPAQAADQPVTEAEVRSALVPLLPAGVRLHEVGFDGERVVAKGISATVQPVSQLLRNIERSANFAQPELRTIAVRADRAHDFEVALQVTCDSTAGGPCLIAEARTGAQAGTVFKCKVDGALRFQDRPCAAGTAVPGG